MKKAFKIAPGRYVIPNIGSVDAQKEVSNNVLFEIYKLPRRVFPWIQLGPDAEAFIKKQKLNVKDFAKLVNNARTKNEIELLARLSATKTIDRIAEVKLQALENIAEK
ncbi:hypothetical protein [Zunongwangia endophytica]|uniref:Uncharacterized protein n=1 Tax=Zunongwangia endophytica TaxID=1808945 RepID=A0ABV8H8B1_9FLAO|nr:hypothetical protein [Zunongwangia endophytica]MDN3595313.1 hypothetical protein [Zunongwangia endophytica]